MASERVDMREAPVRESMTTIIVMAVVVSTGEFPVSAVAALVPAAVELTLEATFALSIPLEGAASLEGPFLDPTAVLAPMLVHVTVAVAMASIEPVVPAGLPERPIAAAVESPLDAIALAVEKVRQSVVAIGRGGEGQEIELQVDQIASLIEASVVAPRLSEGFAAVVAMIEAITASMVVAVSRLRRTGEDECGQDQAAGGELPLPVHARRIMVSRTHRLLLLS